MKKLFVYANWDKQDIKRTWSGTGYALYIGLKRYYDTVGINKSKWSSLSVFAALRRHSLIFEKLYHIFENMYVARSVKNDAPTFMISEVAEIPQESYLFFDNIWQSEYLFRELAEKTPFTKWSYKNVFSYPNENFLTYNIERQYKIIHKSKAVFCMGNWLKEYILTVYPELDGKIFAIGGGINTPTNIDIPIRRDSKKRILFVGRDFYRKGGDLVIEAFKILRERKQDVELVIAGPRKIPTEAINVPGVVFKGDVDNSTVRSLMLSSDVFCMPSRFEAYGLVFIEALTNGLPCVARNAFEMPYFIEQGVTGELISDDNAEDLAKAIETILMEPHYKEAVLNKHEYYYQQYNWDLVCSKIYKVIENSEL